MCAPLAENSLLECLKKCNNSVCLLEARLSQRPTCLCQCRKEGLPGVVLRLSLRFGCMCGDGKVSGAAQDETFLFLLWGVFLTQGLASLGLDMSPSDC